MFICLNARDNSEHDNENRQKRCQQEERASHQVKVVLHFPYLLLVHQAAINSGMKKNMK
jgi:hypothetical protein